MEGLSAKVALVTGAGSGRGIGRQIALALAQQGVKVGCLDRDAALAREAADAIALHDGQALALPADVSNEAAVEAAVDQLAAKFGRIDILVNCAGIVRFRPILTLTTDEWENTLAVNLTGAFLCARAVARRLIARKSPGSIINITSISATLASEQKVHYCVSKAGLDMLTRGLALEWAPYGIRVNAVAPGDIDTDFVQDEHIQRMIVASDMAKAVPLGRRGAPLDVVGAVLFLASEAAAYITGASILVDGGLTAGTTIPAEFKEPRP